MSTQIEHQFQEASKHFASHTNHLFWQLAEQELSEQQKRDLLMMAMTSQYHWAAIGDDENKFLAYMAVARAFAINGIANMAKEYACKAHAYFKHSDETWIRAFSNAILSHALLLCEQNESASTYYDEALKLSNELSDQELAIFNATIARIPNPIEIQLSA